MRVDDRNQVEGGKWQPAAGPQEAQRAGRADGPGSRVSEPGVADGGDRLNLSGVSGRIRLALQSLAEAHAARVESVAARVRGGQYRMDAQALSRAMLAADLGPVE